MHIESPVASGDPLELVGEVSATLFLLCGVNAFLERPVPELDMVLDELVLRRLVRSHTQFVDPFA